MNNIKNIQEKAVEKHESMHNVTIDVKVTWPINE